MTGNLSQTVRYATPQVTFAGDRCCPSRNTGKPVIAFHSHKNSLARIVANTTKYSHITPVRKSLHWLPVLHRSVFKTALLVYKFLHSGHPKYFEPFLKPRHSVYRTRRSQSDGVLLEVPHCASIYKSKKHFGLSFAYDAPRIWNDLPDDVRSAKSLSSFRKKLKTYLFEKAYPP